MYLLLDGRSINWSILAQCHLLISFGSVIEKLSQPSIYELVT